MGELLLTIGLVFELLLGLGTIALTALEQVRLRTWARLSTDPESSKNAARALFEPHRTIGQDFAESVRARSTLDEALVRAIVRSAGEAWAPSTTLQIVMHVLTVTLVFAPASLALVATAAGVSEGFEQVQGLGNSGRYLAGPLALEAPFAALRSGFGSTALLLAGLAGVWALAWWLRRPEAREARFVKALLEVSMGIRPGTAAPVGGRLAELVAPRRDLRRPITAGALWLVAVTLGWGILYSTADLRAANHRPPRYRVWPAGPRAPINLGPDVRLPRHHGGQPYADQAIPTVTIGPAQVMFQGRPLGAVRGGRLGDDWPPGDVGLMAEQLTRGGALTVLGHRTASAREAIIPVLRWFHDEGGIDVFNLILERNIEGGDAQASLQLRILDEAPAGGIVLGIGPEDMEVGQSRIPRLRATWRREVSLAIRRFDRLFKGDDIAPVHIVVEEGVNYDRMMEALGAADDSCDSGSDCGLPGLGLRFHIGGR